MAYLHNSDYAEVLGHDDRTNNALEQQKFLGHEEYTSSKLQKMVAMQK